MLTASSFAQGVKQATDSLMQIATSQRIDSVRVKAFCELAIALIDSSYQSTQRYLNEAQKIARTEKCQSILANGYHQVGYKLYSKGELDLALENMAAALKVISGLNNTKIEGDLYNDIGLIYKNWGKYDAAIEHFGKSMDCYQKGNNLEGIAMASNNIGQIYYYTNNYPKAVEYFKRYYDVNHSLGNSRAVAGASNNIASAYIELNNSDKAMEYYLVALRIYDSLGVQIGVGVIRDNIGTLMQRKGMLSESLSFHLKALDIFRALNSQSRICYSLKNIGHVYHLMGNQKEGANTLEEALAIATRLGIKETEKEIYETLASIYASTNNYAKAYTNLSKYIEVKDSLISEATSLKLREVEAQYQNAQREKEIQILKEESLKEQQRKSIFIAALFSTLVILTLLLLEIRKLRKANSTVKRENDALTQLVQGSLGYSQQASIERLFPSGWLISTCANKPLLLMQATNQLNIKVIVSIACNERESGVSDSLLNSKLKEYISMGSEVITTSYIAEQVLKYTESIINPIFGTERAVSYMILNQTTKELIVSRLLSGFHFTKGQEPELIPCGNKGHHAISVKDSNYLLLFLNQPQQNNEQQEYVKSTLAKITHFSNSDIKETMQSNLLFWRDGLKREQPLILVGIPLD